MLSGAQRTPSRHHAVLEAVGRVWALYPTQRLCQLLVNVTKRNDPFYVEDSELIGHLAAYAQPPEPLRSDQTHHYVIAVDGGPQAEEIAEVIERLGGRKPVVVPVGVTLYRRLLAAELLPKTLDKLADVAYGRYYPDTLKRTANGLSAWAGPPERNPLRRSVKAVLEELRDGHD